MCWGIQMLVVGWSALSASCFTPCTVGITRHDHLLLWMEEVVHCGQRGGKGKMNVRCTTLTSLRISDLSPLSKNEPVGYIPWSVSLLLLSSNLWHYCPTIIESMALLSNSCHHYWIHIVQFSSLCGIPTCSVVVKLISFLSNLHHPAFVIEPVVLLLNWGLVWPLFIKKKGFGPGET